MKINVGKNDICYTCAYGKEEFCPADEDDILFDDTRVICDCHCYKAKKVQPKEKEFVKPTIDEIRAYCNERQNNVDPELFFYTNERNGWVVTTSKMPMKNWKMAILTWEKKNKQKDIQITYENREKLKKVYPQLDLDWDSYEPDDFKLKLDTSEIGRGVLMLSTIQFDILLEIIDDVEIFDYYRAAVANWICNTGATPANHFNLILKWYHGKAEIK